MAEADLWRAFKRGDEQAFNEIYQRFAAVLYNYGYHLVIDMPLVEDAIQDLFAGLWRTRNNLSDTTSIKYYLFRSLRRRLHRLADEGKLPAAAALQPLHAESVETLRIQAEEDMLQLRRLQKALGELPLRQQEVIRLRFYDNFSWEEIAGILQINEQSVRNLVQRAVAKMRQLWR